MRSRRLPLAVLVVASAISTAGFLPFARPALAGTSTNANACLSSATATYSDVNITGQGTASVHPAVAGTAFQLTDASLTAVFDPTLFVAGYRLGLLQVGANNIAATVDATIKASNTTEASNTQSIPVTVVVTINDPTPAQKTSGDETADPLNVTLPLADTTWTPTAATVEFTQGEFTAHAVIGGALAVDLGPCLPSSGLTGCTAGANCTGFTENTSPTPFETTAAGGVTTTTSGGSTTSTTSSSTTTSKATTTTSKATTTTSTTAKSSTTTSTTAAAQANHLSAGRAEMAYDCRGADTASQDILNTLGSLANPPVPPPNHIDVGVVVTTDPIPSPAQGASFQLPIRWGVALPADVVKAATALKITSVPVSGISLAAGVTSGATGPDVTITPPDRVVNLATDPGFEAGPAIGTFTRTGKIGDPIVVAPKQVRLTATVNLGATPMVISLTCDPPPDRTLSLTDAAGATPLLSASSATPSATRAAATNVAGASATRTNAPATRALARTGAPLWAYLSFAVVLIDLGYLALSATWTGKRRSARA